MMKASSSDILLPYHILLVDDNEHESFFFRRVLKEISISTRFSSTDGERLIDYLSENAPPDILFLDLNMPCKNGFECLDELKGNENFQNIPVVIYSNSFDNKVADELYESGAHYYFQKADMEELKEKLEYLLSKMVRGTFARPPREKFVLNGKVEDLKPHERPGLTR